MKLLKTIYFSLFLFISLLGIGKTFAQTLSDYLETGGENNPGLKAKYQQYLAVLERVPQVGALPDPSLSFGYFINPLMTMGGDQVARISVEQMLPWFGTLNTRKGAATQEAKVLFEEFVQLRNALYFNIKRAYFQLYNIQRNITLSQNTIDILESYERLAIRKYENAESSMVDILRVQMKIREERNELFTLKENLSAQYVQMNALLNREPDAMLVLPDTLPLSFAQINTDSLRKLVLENHPSLSLLREESSLLEQEARLADLSSKPELGVGLEYGLMRPSPDLELANNGMDMWMPMISLSIPVFNRGKYTAARQEVKYRQEGNLADIEAQQNELIREVEESLRDYQVAQNKVQLYKAQIESAEQAISILSSAYETTSESFEDILEFQMQLLEYRMLMNEALTEGRIAQAKLDELAAVNVIMINENE